MSKYHGGFRIDLHPYFDKDGKLKKKRKAEHSDTGYTMFDFDLDRLKKRIDERYKQR